MEHLSSEDSNTSVELAEPVRRRGDRRITDVVVPDDRRKGDRREIPGISALFRTLFRRGTGTES